MPVPFRVSVAVPFRVSVGLGVGVSVGVGVGVGCWVGSFSAGVAAGVDGTSVGVEAGAVDEAVGAGDEAVGVGVGEFVGFTGQVGTFVVADDGGAGLDVTGVETGVAGAVRAVSGGTRAGLGVPLVTTGGREAAHPAREVGCAAAVGDFPGGVVVLPCPGCPVPDGVPPPVGVPLAPFTRVPLPSVPAPPRGAPPPFSEVLTWKIAWRTG